MTTVSLINLEASDRARVVRVEGRAAQQLSGFGLFPGTIISVRQTFPSIVIKAEETELALESEVAQNIIVDRLD